MSSWCRLLLERRFVESLVGRNGRQVALLGLGFAASIMLRVVIGGQGVADSAAAGLVFAACLIVLSWKSWHWADWSLRACGWGLLGAAVLFLPVVLLHLSDIQMHGRPAANYALWSLIVTVVAAAEELFLRGVLYDALRSWRGDMVAVVFAALAFAALHVPLYGWHVVPLDFAVGVWLGTLRYASGSWTAPAVTHALADLGAWWIV